MWPFKDHLVSWTRPIQEPKPPQVIWQTLPASRFRPSPVWPHAMKVQLPTAAPAVWRIEDKKREDQRAHFHFWSTNISDL